MASRQSRFQVLDGWRGISILIVLACHLLPLGPKSWDLNGPSGVLGMALFFCLSGFLITTFLLKGGDVKDFLIRRVCRIVPLAWLALPFALLLEHATPETWVRNFFFVANFPPYWIPGAVFHFWSLCVEMQFYAAIALVYGFFGRRGLLVAIPLAALTVTGLRITFHVYYSFATYFRVDEILSGAILALVHSGQFGERMRGLLGRLNPPLMLGLLVCSSLPLLGPFDYARPYIAAALVGATLVRADAPMNNILKSSVLAYIAEISYALYVVHPILAGTWLGSGDVLVRYAKRPLLVAISWGLAHVSTRYYESRWISWGNRLSRHAVMRPVAVSS